MTNSGSQEETDEDEQRKRRNPFAKTPTKSQPESQESGMDSQSQPSIGNSLDNESFNFTPSFLSSQESSGSQRELKSFASSQSSTSSTQSGYFAGSKKPKGASGLLRRTPNKQRSVWDMWKKK